MTLYQSSGTMVVILKWVAYSFYSFRVTEGFGTEQEMI
jgi:hypothetical protein